MVRRLIYPGHSELYGTKKSLCRASKLISQYPLYHAIGCLSRIELLLTDPTFEGGAHLRANQIDICRCTCSQDQLKLIEKVDVETRQKPNADIAPFHRLQLAMAMKLAFLNCLDKGTPPKYLYDLADALFIINDHIGPTPEDKPTEYFLWVKQSQFAFSEVHIWNYLTRWKNITTKVIEKSKQTTLDLEARLKGKYKVDLLSYLIIGIDFYMQWVQFRSRQAYNKGILSIRASELKKRYRFSDEETEQAFKEFCGAPAFFMESIKSKKEDQDPYNNVTFLKRPLVRFDDDILCLGKHFLSWKIGAGIYWLLIELYERGKEDTLRRQVMKLFGKAFESYGLEILKTIYGNGHCSPLIIIDEVIGTSARQGKRKVDALIDCGDALIIVEFKSSPLPLNALTSNGCMEFHDWEKENILKAAEQIYNVICQIQKGELSQVIDHRRIKKYYPLVVTLQNLPTAVKSYIDHLEPEVERITKRELENASVALTTFNIEPINIMNIGEMEVIEAVLTASQNNESFQGLLDKKNTESKYSNWMEFLGRYKYPQNTRLRKQLKEFVAQGHKQVFNKHNTST